MYKICCHIKSIDNSLKKHAVGIWVCCRKIKLKLLRNCFCVVFYFQLLSHQYESMIMGGSHIADVHTLICIFSGEHIASFLFFTFFHAKISEEFC